MSDVGLVRTAALLRIIPDDRPVSLMLRHAAREPGELPDAAVPLTEHGVHTAQALGRELLGRLRSIHTSPILRCRSTAHVLAETNGLAAACVVDDHLLGAPGVFVDDEQLASQTWARRGHPWVLAHLCSGEGPALGFTDPERASATLLRGLIEASERATNVGIAIFVTHDSVLGPALSRWFAPDVPAWPEYLDAVAVWRDGGDIVIRHADRCRTLAGGPDL